MFTPALPRSGPATWTQPPRDADWTQWRCVEPKRDSVLCHNYSTSELWLHKRNNTRNATWSGAQGRGTSRGFSTYPRPAVRAARAFHIAHPTSNCTAYHEPAFPLLLLCLVPRSCTRSLSSPGLESNDRMTDVRKEHDIGSHNLRPTAIEELPVWIDFPSPALPSIADCPADRRQSQAEEASGQMPPFAETIVPHLAEADSF